MSVIPMRAAAGPGRSRRPGAILWIALGVLGLAAFGLGRGASRPEPTAGQLLAEAPATRPTSAPASQAAGLSLRRQEEGLGGAFAPPGPNTTSLVWQMLASALVVLVLGGLAIYAVRRVLPRIGRSTGRSVALRETTFLGAGKSVHLVQVGGRRLLLGASRDRVVLLADVTGAFPQELDKSMRAAEGGGP